MALGTYTKTPSERKRYSVDYYDWLDLGEKISNVSFLITPPEDPDNPGTNMIIDAYALDPDGTEVIFFAYGGLDGMSYLVEIRVLTSGGQVKEDNIWFEIVDLPQATIVETALIS